MRRIIYLLIVLCYATPLHAQTFDTWFQQRVGTLIDEVTIDANSNDPRRQHDAPPIDSNGTALVDRSAASDFLSLAFSLGQHSQTASNGSDVPTGSLTVTAYSLLAWASGKSLTDAEFYKIHTGARRVYFTLGRVESKLNVDGTDADATVVGVKYLLQNDRDIYSKNAATALDTLQKNLKQQAAKMAEVTNEVRLLILQILDLPVNAANLGRFGDESFPSVLEDLRKKPDAYERIDDFLRPRLQAFIEVSGGIRDAANAIANGKQIALSTTAKFRKDPGNQDYNLTFIYDQPLTNRISWVFNAVGDYKDRRTTRDSKGGRASTELLALLTRPANQLWARTPMTLSFSGEAKWATEAKPTYTFQAKLTIPISTGMDLPIVYRYANRSFLSANPAPEARLGLTIDTGRLAQLFH